MKIILLLSALYLTTGIAHADNSASQRKNVNPVNDYPTQGRVEYVFKCMHTYGEKENYNTMYGCVCAIDKIAATIPYGSFVATSTLAVMINTPGEKGGVFRDAPGGRKSIREFRKFLSDTEKSCGLKNRKNP